MLIKFATIYLCFAMPSAAFAELTKAECVQIESLLEKVPQECQVSVSSVLPAPDGAPYGAVWQNHIFFSEGGSELDATALSKLQALSQILEGDVLGSTCLQLIGHSDSSGGSVANQRIGQLRAEKVARYLGALLSDPSRIEEYSSLGETQPLAQRASTDQWQRRVEIRARTCHSLG